VEEFKPKPSGRRFFSSKSKVKEQPLVGRYQLPSIPDDWIPDSVSWQQKWRDVCERASVEEGTSPDLEFYYTQEEWGEIQARKEQARNIELREEARAKVEARVGKPYHKLTKTEIKLAERALGIDSSTGIIPPKPALSSRTESPAIAQLFRKRKAEGDSPGQATQHLKRSKLGTGDPCDMDNDPFLLK
jgi:hypothetical protein